MVIVSTLTTSGAYRLDNLSLNNWNSCTLQ